MYYNNFIFCITMGWLCVNTLTFIEITCQLQVSEFSFLSLHLLLSITSWARWFKFTEPHVLSCGPSHVVAFLKAEGRESGSGCPEWLKYLCDQKTVQSSTTNPGLRYSGNLAYIFSRGQHYLIHNRILRLHFGIYFYT